MDRPSEDRAPEDRACEAGTAEASLSRRGLIAGAAGLAAAVGAVRAATAAPAPAAVSAPMSVDGAVGQMINDKLTPGLQVAIWRKGAFTLSKGYGFANLETSTPMSPASVQHIGSISKQFTAAGLMRMREQGKLDVDAKFSVYYPDFPRGGDITVRQMLTHTSGLGNYTDTKERATFYDRARHDYPSAELYAAMKSQTDPEFVAEPGTAWHYSNSAFVLLGLLFEKLAGEPYAAALRHQVLDPAGLQFTADDDLSEVVPNRASGYTPDQKAPSGYINAAFISMTYPGGAGALRSTCEDLCRWHQALLDGKVVNAESLKMMITPGRLSDGAIPTAKGKDGKPVIGPDGKPVEIKYGFGLGIGEDAHGLSIEHGGGIFGFLSNIKTWVDSRVSLARIQNCDANEASAPKLAPAWKAIDAAMEKAAFG
ncbi:MAG TPA: serine hydrolase domain-containing protein [Caulobacteraceae bacterium]|nr:serine hydrolase domain-containing protein [Caulobacteraceae bacterium]